MGKKAAAAPEPAGDAEKEAAPEEPAEQLQGDFVFQDGSTYSGQYLKKGDAVHLHGEGLLLTGPESYEGTFENGLYKVGKYTSCSGAVYSGNFKGNKFHGVGNYCWPDGREYRGTWNNGDMHGLGTYLNFSVGADKRFVGFSNRGQFASGAREQEEAKKSFLAEYGGQCISSASAALRDIAARATGDGAPAEFLVPQGQEPEQMAERTACEDIFSGPLPEVSATAQAPMQAFAARLDAEVPLEVSVYNGLGGSTRIDGQRLRRPQLQVVGQAVEFFASEAEAGALQLVVLVNVSSEYDVESAKW
eukprot:CAMPEP_0197653138 /NCGR_PEP_ID=MMETSP1338-20131121/34875_1 /TAXON_ID=43686 ORGANISM="Pelagodinium beii, Strain RCC1491" /NCGR_SAMPLE_ID=MMETSP1338 /ASSEMBLY_ACC=CAM_ASM_000754 /LENGTH=303 /DNA_ID=CAMNT_0043228157 /DNA_START=66 /DNA_END=974 /DNA_ORIENTATION=+